MRFASSLLLTIALAACGAHSQPAATTPAATAAAAPAGPAADAPLVAPGEAKLGDTTTCPISHEKFVVAETSPHADYNGKTYYFCCPDCAAKFKSDPAKYAPGA